jgi:transcriptional regulator with XRE-family HTH domain
VEPVGEWTSPLVRALRRALRLTQERFAGHLGMAPRTVRDWEAGRPIALASQEVLDGALAATTDDQRARFEVLLDETREEDQAKRRDVLKLAAAATVGRLLTGEWTDASPSSLLEQVTADEAADITPTVATRLAHEWLVTEPPQLVEVRAGRRIGEALVHKVERRTGHLRRMDDFIGGGDLHVLVEAELRSTIRLLREAAYSEVLGRRLLSSVADLRQLAGWVAADAGLPTIAARHYSGGIRAAHAAGDAPLAGNLVSLLSYLYANKGSPHEAVLLAHTAYAGAKHRASATTKALLQERVAWAHARAGEPRQTERALGTVDQLYERREPACDPAWVYWLDRREIEVMAGRCYTELRQPARAEPLLRRALDSYDADHVRETALYSSWLAETYVQAGDVDEAARQASRSLTSAAQVNSSRGLERVRVLRLTLEPYRHASAVRDFEKLCQDLAVTPA